jgi:hypothetical protein
LEPLKSSCRCRFVRAGFAPNAKIDGIAALVQQIGAQTRKSSSHFIPARILNRCGSCVQRYW